MPVRKVGARWLIDIRFRGERYRTRSPGTTRADAQAHETYLRGELAMYGNLKHLDEHPEDTLPVPTFAEFAERWMAVYPASVRNKPSEVASKRSILRAHLVPHFGTRSLDTLGVFEIEEYKAACLMRGLAPKTINNVLTVLQRLLRSAEEWNVLERVPRVGFMPVDPPDFRFLTEEDACRLVDATDDDAILHAAILLGWQTGLRWGEISALGWDDVNFERRLVHVRCAFSRKSLESPKNRRPRYVPMTETLARALDKLPRFGRYVLMRRGRPLVEQTALVHLRSACRRAGIAPCGYHVLRHTFASHLVQRGVPLAVIKDLLGHSSIKMTERYAHLQPKDAAGSRILAAAVSLLERPDDGHPVGTRAQVEAPPRPLARMRAFDSALNQQENTAGEAMSLLEA